MSPENPLNNARDFFNQEDYDRHVKAGVKNFIEGSSIPVPEETPKEKLFKALKRPGYLKLNKRELLAFAGGSVTAGMTIVIGSAVARHIRKSR